MTRRTRSSWRAFTLVETVVSIVVIGVVAAAAVPVVNAVSTQHAAAAATRRNAERAAFALERVVRLMRDIPNEDGGGLSIKISGPASLVLTDGRGLRWDGQTLYEAGEGGEEQVLASGVELFELTLLGPDGVTPADAGTAHVVQVVIAIGGFELRSVAFPRVRALPE